MKFSYLEYNDIITILTAKLPLYDYKDVTSAINEFLVVRHDVEFSVQRALDMAIFEHEKLDIHTSYFFQLRNNSYNILSNKNLKIVNKIIKMGHFVGLHVYTDTLPIKRGYSAIVRQIQCDIGTLERYLDIHVDRFSLHRPTNKLLKLNIQVPNKINVYGLKYFHHFSDAGTDNLQIKYLSDSNHKWKYGYPLEIEYNTWNKVQLLIHPFSWTDQGADNLTNFSNLIEEKTYEIICSINNETKTFPSELLDDA